MDPAVKAAYDYLTPADQLVVDSVIMLIAVSQQERDRLAKELFERLGDVPHDEQTPAG